MKSILGAKLSLRSITIHRHFLEEILKFKGFLEVMLLLRQEFPQLLFNSKMLTHCLTQCFSQNF